MLSEQINFSETQTAAFADFVIRFSHLEWEMGNIIEVLASTSTETTFLLLRGLMFRQKWETAKRLIRRWLPQEHEQRLSKAAAEMKTLMEFRNDLVHRPWLPGIYGNTFRPFRTPQTEPIPVDDVRAASKRLFEVFVELRELTWCAEQRLIAARAG